MIYLVEIDVYDPALAAIRTLRYGSAAYLTGDGDDPANVEFEPRVSDPGNYERHMFAPQRTTGESEVGSGVIALVNADRELDELLDLGFDGRAMRIFAVPDATTPWAERATILVGTMEQATFPSRKVEIRIRDRLALLREPILTETYLGTTTEGGRADAEGGKDLKDVRKPKLFGRRLNVSPVEVDAFDRIYQVSSNGLSQVVRVMDSMVPRTPTADQATLAALKAASLAGSQYATCLALGLIRLGARAFGTLTVEVVEGASLADRSAARIVQRMLAGIGTIALEDFDALHAAAPAECGIWIAPGETDILSAANAVLRSVGAYLTVDRLGVFRVGRLNLPTGDPVMTIDEDLILEDGEALSRLATADDGDGVPAWKVTVRYAVNDTVMQMRDVDTTAAQADRSFAERAWRQVSAENAAIKTAHPLAPEMVFETLIVKEADAQAEADRWLSIYGTRRDLFSLTVPSDEVQTLDLGDVVEVMVPRFGMDGGRLFLVLGITATHARKTTTIEAWG